MSRTYKGVSAAERRALRHEQLVEAGLEVFGTAGYAGSTVRDVCRAAGLTERYFYESFADKEALLARLAERIVQDFLVAVAPSLPPVEEDLQLAAREVAAAFVSSLADDPRRARILLVETVGVSPTAEDRRREIIGGLVGFILLAAEQIYGEWVAESKDAEVAARALVGAAQEVLVAFVRGELDMTRDELVESLAGLFTTTGPIVAAMEKAQR